MTISQDPADAALPLRVSRPDPVPSADLVRRASAAARLGDTPTAVDLLKTVARGYAEAEIALSPKTENEIAGLADDREVSPVVQAAAWAAWARSRRSHGAHEEALAAIDTATELHPSPQLVIDWIDTARSVYDLRRRVARFEVGLASWPDAAEMRILGAELALAGADLPAARTYLDATPAGTPLEGRRLRALARLELMEGRPAMAIEPARALLRIRPAEARGLLIVALHRLEQLAADVGLVGAVVAAPPDDLWILARLGEALDAEGLRDPARKILDHAVDRFPEDIDVLVARGRVLAGLEYYDLASVDLDRAVHLGAEDPDLDVDRGELALRRGHAARAVTLLDRYVQHHRSLRAHRALAEALYANHDLVRARDAFQALLDDDPTDVRAMWGRAQVALALGGDAELTLAETLLTRAWELDSEDIRYLAVLGEVRRRSGLLSEAEATFSEALGLRPDCTYVLAKKGQVLLDLGRSREALPFLEEAGELEPTAEWILDALEIALADVDPARTDASLRRVQRALRTRGLDLGPVRIRRARAARRRRRWSDADRLYSAAREARPLDRDLASEHADVLRIQGRRSEALALVSAFPPACEDERDLSWQRIELLWQMDRLDDVRAELERLNEQPDVPLIAVAGLGALRRQEGRREESRVLLEGALRREPRHPYVLASLGALDWDEDQVDAARSSLYAALGDDPGYGFALETLTALEIDQGRDDAVRRLIARVDRSVADPDLVTLRATCQHDLGDYRGAVSTLQQYLDDVGDDAVVLRGEGRAQLALGNFRRAGSCFAAAAGLDDRPRGLIEVVSALTRLDRWDEALRLADSRRKDGVIDAGNEVALSVVARRCGAVSAAGSLAENALARQPVSVAACTSAARAARLSGARRLALQRARQVRRLEPVAISSATELAECLWAAGHEGAAHRAYGDLLERLDRRTHPSPDQLALRGWCLLRLGRLKEASGVFVRTLALTNRTATTFLDLALVSILERDVHEARLLVERARDELELVSTPVRRGILTRAVHSLAETEEHAHPRDQRPVAELRELLVDDRERLTGQLERRYQALPFPL